jgi:hypothetical protein
VTGGEARLQNAEKKLKQHWQAVCADWRDDKAREFEDEIIQPLLTRLRTVERAMGQLSLNLQQARRDCE